MNRADLDIYKLRLRLALIPHLSAAERKRLRLEQDRLIRQQATRQHKAAQR
jgi:hypothetical protein